MDPPAPSLHSNFTGGGEAYGVLPRFWYQRQPSPPRPARTSRIASRPRIRRGSGNESAPPGVRSLIALLIGPFFFVVVVTAVVVPFVVPCVVVVVAVTGAGSGWVTVVC